MPVAAVTLAEIGSGFASGEFVPARAGCVDDIRTKQVGTCQCQRVIPAVYAIARSQQVTGKVVTDRLGASLTDIPSEQRVIVAQLIIDAADPVLPVVNVRITVVHLAAGIVGLRQK